MDSRTGTLGDMRDALFERAAGHPAPPPPDALDETGLTQIAGGPGCLSEIPPPGEW